MVETDKTKIQKITKEWDTVIGDIKDLIKKKKVERRVIASTKEGQDFRSRSGRDKKASKRTRAVETTYST